MFFTKYLVDTDTADIHLTYSYSIVQTQANTKPNPTYDTIYMEYQFLNLNDYQIFRLKRNEP